MTSGELFSVRIFYKGIYQRICTVSGLTLASLQDDIDRKNIRFWSFTDAKTGKGYIINLAEVSFIEIEGAAGANGAD